MTRRLEELADEITPDGSYTIKAAILEGFGVIDTAIRVWGYAADEAEDNGDTKTADFIRRHIETLKKEVGL
jgi:hypothetical protein